LEVHELAKYQIIDTYLYLIEQIKRYYLNNAADSHGDLMMKAKIFNLLILTGLL